MAYEEIEDTTFQKAETGTMFLELVKRDLQITWTDKETEKILTSSSTSATRTVFLHRYGCRRKKEFFIFTS